MHLPPAPPTRSDPVLIMNYQMRSIGGEGHLWLLEFLPDGKTVQVRTHSRFLNKYLLDDEQQLVLTLD